MSAFQIPGVPSGERSAAARVPLRRRNDVRTRRVGRLGRARDRQRRGRIEPAHVAVLRFGRRRLVLVAQPEIQGQLAADLPVVLHEERRGTTVLFSRVAVDVDRCRRLGSPSRNVATSWKFCAAELFCCRVNAALLRHAGSRRPAGPDSRRTRDTGAGRSRRASSGCRTAWCKSAGTSRSIWWCCRRGCRRCR